MWFSVPLRKSPFMPSMPTAARCCGKTSSANKPGASMEATDIVLAPQWQATSWLRVRSCSASAGAYSESTRYRIPKRLEGGPDGLVRVIRKRHRTYFSAVPRFDDVETRSDQLRRRQGQCLHDL